MSNLLARLRTFVRIVELGSLSRAARVERLSLPAISRQLNALEDELGAKLIIRTTRKLRTTDAGREFHARATHILRDVEDAMASVSGSEVRGTLSVSAPFTLGMKHVLPRLMTLLERHPALSVDCRLEDHLVDLVAERIDVVIRAGVEIQDSVDLIAHPFLEFERFVVASPRLLRQRGVPRTPEALAKEKCILQLMPSPGSQAWFFTRDGEEQRVEVAGRFRATAPAAAREAALAHIGFARLPEWLVADDIASGRLCRVLADWRSAPATAVALFRREMRGAPRLRAFVDAIQASSASRKRDRPLHRLPE